MQSNRLFQLIVFASYIYTNLQSYSLPTYNRYSRYIYNINSYTGCRLSRNSIHLQIRKFQAIASISTKTMTSPLLSMNHLDKSLDSTKLNGILTICQQDSYMRNSRNKVLERQQNEDGTFSIVLDDSCLYAEGGGQPFDLGTVEGIPVLAVHKHESLESHTQVKITLQSKLDENIDIVNCEVDWNRRYDFMQQHTAQHLFSAIAEQHYQADTTSWTLGMDNCTVELLHPTAPLTQIQLDDIEMRINQEIHKCVPVTWKLYSKDELEKLDNLRGLPKGAAASLDQLRFVDIAGVDMNPCGGTHLRNLSEIQLLKIISTEKSGNYIRVKFVSGFRALKYFKKAVDRENQLNIALSSLPENHLLNIEKLYQDKKVMSKTIKTLEDEIVNFLASSICKYIDDTKANMIVYHRTIEADVNFLFNIADIVSSIHPNVMIFLSAVTDSSSNAQALMGDKKKTKGKDSKTIQQIDFSKQYVFPKSVTMDGVFVLFGPKDTIDNVKVEILDVIKGKGGGRPGKLQGTALGLENIELVRDILRRKSSEVI